MATPLHPNEAARLESLARHALSETAPDRRFNRLIYIAAQILRVRVCYVSVVGEDHQWFMAAIGATELEGAREAAFCSHTILQEGMMIVEDTHHDFRFADHPAVTRSPFVRFYAGVPLRCRDGLPLGALCVVDNRPRTITMEQKNALLVLSQEAEDLVQSTHYDH